MTFTTKTLNLTKCHTWLNSSSGFFSFFCLFRVIVDSFIDVAPTICCDNHQAVLLFIEYITYSHTTDKSKVYYFLDSLPTLQNFINKTFFFLKLILCCTLKIATSPLVFPIINSLQPSLSTSPKVMAFLATFPIN
jgi:hypothetical protein